MSARTIWILTHHRTGDRRQMEQLASMLGWPSIVKTLTFRPPNVPFLASLLLDRARSDPLEPPWPDVVLCAEARTSVIARAIKHRSQGSVKVICLGRPAGDPAGFDLVLTTAQYRLAKAPNILELALPLAAGSSRSAAATEPGDTAGMENLARPVTAVFVGGTSLPELLDGKAAAVLAQRLTDHARKSGGTLLVTTSPRTDQEAGLALARTVPAPHVVHRWHEGESNPYRGFLAHADEIIVTSDSVSMVADALATQKTVLVYRLPRKWTARHRITEWLFQQVASEPRCPLWLRPVKWLFDKGLIEARADRTRLFDRLAREGRLGWFGETGAGARNLPGERDIEPIVARILDLWPKARDSV